MNQTQASRDRIQELLKLITGSTDAALAKQIEIDGSSLDQAQFKITYLTRLAAAIAASLQELAEERAIPKWE